MNTVKFKNNIPTMTSKELAIAYEAEEFIKTQEQIDITTYHTLHSGIYTRRVMLLKGQVIAGVEMLIPTTLVVSGHLSVFIGGKVMNIVGTSIILADKGRKQVMHAVEDTSLTMMFATSATTIEEAEAEFALDPSSLVSRLDDAINKINISGV